MIAYFDTSAIVTLVIEEPGTAAASTVWDSADRVVSVRLARVEARAALAQATLLGRLTPAQHRRATTSLDMLLDQVDWIELDDVLLDSACDLAEARAMCAYDAVHLAAAERLGAQEVLVVAGDRALLEAAAALGISVARLR